MTTQDLNSSEAASVVHARESACPGPLLEAKKGIGTVKVGEVLKILPTIPPPRTTYQCRSTR